MRKPERAVNELIKEFGLWFLIKEDFNSHARDWTRPGFRAMVVYRFGTWALGLRPYLVRAVVYRFNKVFQRYVRNHYGIEMSAKAKIGRRFQIGHQGAIVIHEFATIGDDCLIRQGVTLGAGIEFSVETAPTIGDRVAFGAGAMIIGKVRIGDDAKIGPNAVVMQDVPADATVMPPLARILPRPDLAPQARRTDTVTHVGERKVQ
jgi:serine O-acetyltransferase